MKLSVIIVNYNVKYFLELCLDSVSKAMNGIDGEVIVVDNHSQDGSCDLIRQKFPQVTLIENLHNTGFSKANNQGVAIAKGEYILFLNPDTVMPENFLQQMLTYMDAHTDAGAIGPRLIDGKGQFAPDAKKSFPTLSVALFKTTGINKLFPRSAFFNKYYAVHIGEHETAEVEVLSGCCMMVRKNALEKAGGAFDEDYFMYCEDVDLSYRIKQAGYKNIYYPEATLIHYKGESTRKATLSYVRIFNEALATFVKKHYSKTNARIFILFINVGIVSKAIFGALKRVLNLLRMPLLDALVLLACLWFMKEFYVEHIRNILPIPVRSLYFTFPAYVFIWVLSMFLNGAYDQPYRVLRVVRGMLIGMVICLAYFGLLPSELRYSRGIIVFTSFSGAILLVALHELLFRLGVVKITSAEALPHKAVIVASEEHFEQTSLLLQKVNYAPRLYGRVSVKKETEALTDLDQLKPFLYTAGINEIIFCVNGLSYKTILEKMQECGGAYDYKIHLPGSPSFIGSNSSSTAGDLYTTDKHFSIARFAQQRNKRLVDVVTAICLLVFYPLALFIVKNPVGLLRNIFWVLFGKYSWVGYDLSAGRQPELPKIKPSVLPPYHLLQDYHPDPKTILHLNMLYAQNFKGAADLSFITRNFAWLGNAPEKDFAENE